MEGQAKSAAYLTSIAFPWDLRKIQRFVQAQSIVHSGCRAAPPMSSTLVGSSAGCTVEWGAQRLVYSVDTPVLARAGTLSIIRQALVRRSRSVSMQLEDISYLVYRSRSVGMHLEDTRGAQWLVYSIDTPLSLFGLAGGSQSLRPGISSASICPPFTRE